MSSAGQNKLAQKRRKLKKRNWDGVTDDQIFQRDDWQCQLAECLCPDGRHLDQSLRGAIGGPWVPAIHHVVRLADGGLSNAGNKLAAHSQCSSMANREIQRAQARKAADPAPGEVQVRLIGLPADIDAVLAALASSGNWEAATRTAAPREQIPGQEKVIGLLTVRHGRSAEDAGMAP
jgi:hypothetical protein